MATQRLSAELQIDAGLGASFTRAFDKLDARVNASTRKLQDIGKGAFDKLSVRNATRQLDKATQQLDSAFMRVFRNFETRFMSATDTAFNYLKRKLGRAKIGEVSIGVNVDDAQRAPPAHAPSLAGAAAGFAVSALRRGFPAVFKDTNVQLMEAQENIRGLKRQGKNFEELARHARTMDKAVSPWLRKIDQVNRELAVQERKIDHLRLARTRLNKAERQFNEFRSRVAPLARTAAFGALGAAATGGYALARGAEAYSNLDQVFRVLQAEGVTETDIPLIREQVFRLAETTQFTDVEIANVLVGMKKDGQAVTAELTGVSDILKLAVAESRSLEAAWDATRTLINTTGTDLAGAIKLQEQLSNATSVSALNMEQLQYIAGQSLSIYKGIAAFDPADFLALSGALGGILRPERIATGLREFALTLADAAAGNLSAPRQEAFDLLNVGIKDEEGKLKDAVSILQEFEQAFNRPAFLDKQGQLIGDKVQPISAQIFGREALPTVANLLFKSEQIAKNIEAINTPGTLERKSSVMEQSIDAAVNRLKSAVSVLSQRFFEALDGDGNFNRIVDGMSAKVQQLSAWLTESDTQIESAFKSFLSVAGQIASAGAAVFGKLFAYLREHGPQIRAFFADFWKELQGVWTTIKPVVMGVLAGLREMFEVVSRLTGGNTKLLAWLASAYVGWKLLETPILAVNAGYNSVLGTVHKLSAAYAGMRMPALSAPLPPLTPPQAGGKVAGIPAQAGGKLAQAGGNLAQAARNVPVFLGRIRPLLARIGRLLAPILVKVAALGPAFAKVGTFISPLLVKIVSIGPAFLKIGGFISPVLAEIAAIGPAILAVLGGITAPVTAVIAAIVAVVAGGVALVIANWDKAKAALKSTVETIKLVGQVIWEGLLWLGRNIVRFFMNIGPNVQRVVSAMGTHIGAVFKGVGDWLMQYLGPVGTFIVNVFLGVAQGVSWAAAKVWAVLKGVGLAIGGFFKSVFGGIVSGIVATVDFLKKIVGDFFEWVVRINEKVQGVLRKIRDFFRKDKEQGKAAELKLKEVHNIDLDVAMPDIPRQVVAADVQFTSIQKMETAQEFYLRAPELPERRKANELRSYDFLLGEVAVQTPPELKTPPMPELEMPQTPELTLPQTPELETPAAPELSMPAAPELSMPAAPELSMPAAPELRMPAAPELQGPQTGSLRYEEPTTVEYVDFSSVDEIDKTLKAGFKSLLHVSDAILKEIRKPGKDFTNVLKQESGVADVVSVNLSQPEPVVQLVEVAAPVVQSAAKTGETIKREVFEKQATIEMVTVSPVIEMPQSRAFYEVSRAQLAPTEHISRAQLAPTEHISRAQLAPTEHISRAQLAPTEETIVQREVFEIVSPVVSVPELQDIGAERKQMRRSLIRFPSMDAPTVAVPELQDIRSDRTDSWPVPAMEDIRIDSPVVSIPETEAVSFDAPVVEIPKMEDIRFDAPVVDSHNEDIRIDTPTVSIPEMEDIRIDSPVVSIPDMPDIGIDAPTVGVPLGRENIEIVFSLPVVAQPGWPVLPQEQERMAPALVPIGEFGEEKQTVSDGRGDPASTQKLQGNNVEITNHNSIVIHQQPGEDAELLTARILRELERRHRTEAYQ